MCINVEKCMERSYFTGIQVKRIKFLARPKLNTRVFLEAP